MKGQFEWMVMMGVIILLLGYTLYTAVNLTVFLSNYLDS